MELFFDLIFVAAIAQAGAPMHSEYTFAGVFRFAFMFVLIWRAWTGHTFFCTRFDTDDLLHRLLILVQCFVAAVMAANARKSLDSSSSAGFGAAYAGMRSVLALQYLRASRIAQVRDIARRYAVGITASAILWIVSAVVDLPIRYWLWAVALAADFATPWLAGRYFRRVPPDATHLPERFGLFTIILLGEFVASVMHGIETQDDWTFAAASTAFMSMAMAFVLWWWYFEGAGVASERHIRGARDIRLFHVWTYAHFPLVLASVSRARVSAI
jgi:low temperature requirement protein LtrA